MKPIQPRQPSQVSPYVRACLEALLRAGVSERISIGGAFGLCHYIDYRLTHDVDAWWHGSLTERQKQEVSDILKATLAAFGTVYIRAWGDVLSIELSQEDITVFSFQIAARNVMLEEPASAGWIDIPLDSFSDLVASKMVALVERGAPRDFLDIYTICQAQLSSIEDCWLLWRRRQTLAGSDVDMTRARLAIETHLERLSLHRPLGSITDLEQRQHARQLRAWFLTGFLRIGDG